MDLVDALCSQTRAKSIVELSLEPCFRRHFSAIFHALEEYRPGADDPAQLAGRYLPEPEQRRFWLHRVDVTAQPRPGTASRPRLRWAYSSKTSTLYCRPPTGDQDLRPESSG